MAEIRMCVNCGKTVPASHPRHEPLPECIGPDGFAACTFDMTLGEAWQHWRQKAHEARATITEQAATIARLEGERDEVLRAQRDDCHERRAAAERRAEQVEQEAEKWRGAASVLCAAHVGVPQAMCPVCRAEQAEAERDRLRAENELMREALERAREELRGDIDQEAIRAATGVMIPAIDRALSHIDAALARPESGGGR